MAEDFAPKPWFFANAFWKPSYVDGEVVAFNKAPAFTEIGLLRDDEHKPRWIKTSLETGELRQGNRAALILLVRTDTHQGHFLSIIQRERPWDYALLPHVWDDWPFYPHAQKGEKHDTFELLYYQHFITRRSIEYDADQARSSQLSLEAYEDAIQLVTKEFKLWREYQPKQAPYLHIGN